MNKNSIYCVAMCIDGEEETVVMNEQQLKKAADREKNPALKSCLQSVLRSGIHFEEPDEEYRGRLQY